jgi:hypothetical protein
MAIREDRMDDTVDRFDSDTPGNGPEPVSVTSLSLFICDRIRPTGDVPRPTHRDVNGG